MGNAESSRPAAPSNSSPVADNVEHTIRSYTTLSSFASLSDFEDVKQQEEDEDEDEDEDCYKEVVEDTHMCSSLFARKNDPLLIQSSNTENRGMRRSVSSCYPSEHCSPPTLPRSISWTNMDYLAYTLDELAMHNGDLPTEESDLRPSTERCRTFWVVTTAALPWQTGTAVNPLLRAAHLSQLNRPYANGVSTVTLVVPWLESSEERVTMYGREWEHKTQADQDAHIRAWLSERAGLPLEASLEHGGIHIRFYPARLHSGMNSIFAMGDICSSIKGNKDVCFLEEPEHLNWFRAPTKNWWTSQFVHVVGIGHTNYQAYVREHFVLASPVVGTISSLMVRAYCHKLIKLSGVLQTYAPEKEVICNIHGIRSEFLQAPPPVKGIYFIGKLLWAKGFDKLIELQMRYRKMTGDYFSLDIFGSGPEEEEIKRAFRGSVGNKQERNPDRTLTSDFPKSRFEFRKDAIPAHFKGRRDHAECLEYKIFVNPSITEVLCTTTAEAIAMGKFVLVPVHPSNSYFSSFPNCLQYSSKHEFVTFLQYAMTHDPETLSPELKHELTWEAATERCLEAASISRRDARRRERVGKTKLDHKIATIHYELGKGVKGDVIRKFLGGGPVSNQVHYEKTSKEVSID